MQSKLAAVIAAAVLAGSIGGAAAFPRFTTDLSAFRSGPGLTFNPVMAIPPQTLVDVRGCHDGWCRVNYAGARGFVASSLLARPVVVGVVRGAPPAAAPAAAAAPAVVGTAVAPVVTPAAPAPMTGPAY